MTYKVRLERRLPRPVEVPCDYGRLTRMRATHVIVNASDQWSGSLLYVTVSGPGIRKDGSTAKGDAYAYVSGAGAPERNVTQGMLGDDNWQIVIETRAAVEAAMHAIVAVDAGGDES
ncbi:hypothetical protein [Actinomyces succiniciruminis]|uniref:Uncharacterized protein n=1 Tax=Actinomyces succiniciruminis TaxID=1522002 RepID=A0A1L7R9R3_9ACTO|nr:hypothetical protein [Actinomyces succiniciruminis]CED90595.1 Hypothetical protein AAM4_0763 [Actinomyces succiniciruminis]